MSYLSKTEAKKAFRKTGNKVYSSYSSARKSAKKIRGRVALMNIGGSNYIIKRV